MQAGVRQGGMAYRKHKIWDTKINGMPLMCKRTVYAGQRNAKAWWHAARVQAQMLHVRMMLYCRPCADADAVCADDAVLLPVCRRRCCVCKDGSAG